MTFALLLGASVSGIKICALQYLPKLYFTILPFTYTDEKVKKNRNFMRIFLWPCLVLQNYVVVDCTGFPKKMHCGGTNVLYTIKSTIQ